MKLFDSPEKFWEGMGVWADESKQYAEDHDISLEVAVQILQSAFLLTMTKQVKWWADASQHAGQKHVERLDAMQASIDRLTDDDEGWKDVPA